MAVGNVEPLVDGMTEIRYLYITVKDLADAQKLARRVLEARLAACANIFPEMNTMYWWQGEIQTGTEAVLILKTRADKVDEAIQAIKLWHSYSVPCILSIPIEKGDEPYINWLKGEVKN